MKNIVRGINKKQIIGATAIVSSLGIISLVISKLNNRKKH